MTQTDQIYNETKFYVTQECCIAQQNFLNKKDDVSWIEKMNDLEYNCMVHCGEACSSFYLLAPSILLMTLFTIIIK